MDLESENTQIKMDHARDSVPDLNLDANAELHELDNLVHKLMNDVASNIIEDELQIIYDYIKYLLDVNLK